MVNYQKERVKLTNTQSNKLISAAKDKKGAVLRLNVKNFELPSELFVTTRHSIKICTAIANNTSNNNTANIKLSKDQILKFSQGSVTVL